MNLSSGSRPVRRPRGAVTGLLAGILLAGPAAAVAGDAPASTPATVEVSGSQTTPPLRLTCERIEFDRATDIFRAMNAVTVRHGDVRLTADRATLRKRSGILTAAGRVRLTDRARDVRAESITIDTNTESGTITNGRVWLKSTNTWIRGRLFQRFSETHYRAKDGMVTNCDADDGQVPDWSFSFHDLDVEQGGGIFADKVWLNIRGRPIVPLPALRYPAAGERQTGLLIPTIGFDDVFGFQYRQGWYWAASPSQDLTVAPQVLSNRGQGGDVGWRYILDRRSRGRWLLNVFHDADEEKSRAQVTGSHVQRLRDDLLVRATVNYATDRRFLRDLSSSGAFRALPSQESLLRVTRPLAGGRAYFTAQYLQPLDAGGRETFQRLPEFGHRYRRVIPAGDTVMLDVGLDSAFVHFVREKGFDVSRFDILPSVSIRGLHLGHMLGLRPRVMVREVVYSRSVVPSSMNNDAQDEAPGAGRGRGTFWLGLEAVTNLSRGFSAGRGRRLRHTMTPRLFYEYVPPSRQADLPQVDAVDHLPKKHLVTYSLRTGLRDERRGTESTTVADVEVAQSYHLGDAPGRANTLSDVWTKAALRVPTASLPAALSRAGLRVDGFYAPGDGDFTQLNAGLVAQSHRRAYLDVGYRRTLARDVPRRGDIWNPLSFNEVLEANSEIHFFTGGGAVRLSRGWTAGTKVYHDVATGKTPEWNVVGLYQNPCRCWSLGLYYIRLGAGGDLPERNQVNFVLTLRGVGSTVGAGTRILRSILEPLLEGEPGLPWAPR